MGLSGGLATNGTSGGGSGVTRDTLRLQAFGVTGQTAEVMNYATSTAPGTQAVQYALVGLSAGDVVTNIFVDVAAVGSGTVPTAIYLGLYSSAGAQLAVTANVASSTIWTATAKIVSVPVATPYTVTTSGGYYLAFLKNGTFASVDVKLRNNAGGNDINQNAPSGLNFAASQAGQATLPSPTATFGNATIAFWFGWS